MIQSRIGLRYGPKDPGKRARNTLAIPCLTSSCGFCGLSGKGAAIKRHSSSRSMWSGKSKWSSGTASPMGALSRSTGGGVKLGVCSLTLAEGSRPIPRAMVVKWNPPDHPWIKLNTDGSYNEVSNRAGGGGVIRDHTGRLLVAFATPLEAHSAVEAELLAMHHGLLIAKEFDRPIWLESDAAQAVKLSNGTSWGPAHTRRAMALLAIFKRQNSLRATFTHREGNTLADLLAKMGIEKDGLHRMTDITAPRILKAIIRMEELGIPNIRVRDDDPG